MKIKVADYSSQTMVSEINRLLAQLSSNAKRITLAFLKEIVKQENVHLFLVIDDEKGSASIVGMAVIYFAKIPSGTKAHIDDVVIDKNFRRKGLGKELVKKLIVLAKEKGARCIDLTSKPVRTAANKLYPSLGFKKRETNVYRFELDK